MGHDPYAAEKRLSAVCSSPSGGKKSLSGPQGPARYLLDPPCSGPGWAPRDKEQAPGLISARQSRHLAVWGRCVEYQHLTLVQDLRIPSQASHCKWESAHFPELETGLPEGVKRLLGILCLPLWKPSKMIIVQTVTNQITVFDMTMWVWFGLGFMR